MRPLYCGTLYRKNFEKLHVLTCFGTRSPFGVAKFATAWHVIKTFHRPGNACLVLDRMSRFSHFMLLHAFTIASNVLFSLYACAFKCVCLMFDFMFCFKCISFYCCASICACLMFHFYVLLFKLMCLFLESYIVK